MQELPEQFGGQDTSTFIQMVALLSQDVCSMVYVIIWAVSEVLQASLLNQDWE